MSNQIEILRHVYNKVCQVNSSAAFLPNNSQTRHIGTLLIKAFINHHTFMLRLKQHTLLIKFSRDIFLQTPINTNQKCSFALHNTSVVQYSDMQITPDSTSVMQIAVFPGTHICRMLLHLREYNLGTGRKNLLKCTYCLQC